MPTWLAIVLGVLLALIVLLAAGGAIARRRQMEASEGRFDEHLSRINRELAAARAEDRGWERSALEVAARAAWSQARPGTEPGELTLVQIIDRPGTDDDKAVFRAASGARLTLGREDGAWVLETLD